MKHTDLPLANKLFSFFARTDLYWQVSDYLGLVLTKVITLPFFKNVYEKQSYTFVPKIHQDCQ